MQRGVIILVLHDAERADSPCAHPGQVLAPRELVCKSWSSLLGPTHYQTDHGDGSLRCH